MRMKKDPLTLALGDIRWETTPTGTSLGGAAAAFAARLAALGRSVRCAGIVGADSRGDNALVELAAWRVDTALVQRDIAEETESVQLDVLDDGTSVVRSHTRGAAANFAWTPELQEAADELDVLFWSSVTQRDPISAETFSRFLEGSPPSFKVFDIDCASGIPTQGELEAGLAVASVAHIRGRDLVAVCRILGLPDLEPGLLGPALTERFGVSYAVLADPLQGALISSIVGEQVGMDIKRENRGDLLGWHEALLAGFVHHVFLGSSLARCCGAAVQYAQAVGGTNGSVAQVTDLDLESVKIGG